MLAFLDGNDLVVRGAVDAGCRFFAGYPITPTSSLMNGMMEALPKVGGIALQAEDEIASIGFCLGAAMAGMKALTASSGPGLSLYSENIGLAIMGEIPLVIVISQRQGPATGSATQVAQGDIQFIRWGTSGGMPVVALYPADPAGCYTLTMEAFDIAEEIRGPVFLVMDKELSMTRERVDLEKLVKPRSFHRDKLQDPAASQPSCKDVPTLLPACENGTESPALKGMSMMRTTTSSHDPRGHLTGDPDTIQGLIDRLVGKIEGRREELCRVVEDLQEGSELLVISYGITARSASEAVGMARRGGARTSHLIIHSIWPVPETAIRKAAKGIRKVVVPELNMGQYVLEVARVLGVDIEVAGVHQMNTRLLTPETILKELT